MIDNTPYMARGIYVDAQGNDQNHTFCAIGHKYNGCYSFSIIECVTSILVLNSTSQAQCTQIEQAFAVKYGHETPMHVVNKETMQKKYKHILWVGQYMVFECIAAQNLEKSYISFGAGSYFEYTGKSRFALSIWGNVLVYYTISHQPTVRENVQSRIFSITCNLHTTMLQKSTDPAESTDRRGVYH